MSEPEITINGILCNDTQAMTIRVALESYYSLLQDPDHLGEDHLGRDICKNYRQTITEIRKLIFKD